MSFYPNFIQVLFILYPNLSSFGFLGHLLLSITLILLSKFLSRFHSYFILIYHNFVILGHLLLSITPILGNGLQWLRTSSSLPQFDWQTSRPSSFERDTHPGKEFHNL